MRVQNGQSNPSGRVAQRHAVLVVYVLGLFVSIIDVTIVNVALPQIASSLHVETAALAAISVGYLVAFAVVIPASGWLGDRFGGAPVLIAAIALFTVASGLCGIATSLGELVAFRVLQGLGGGLLTPVGLAMLYRSYPPNERIAVSARTAVVTGLAPILGPTLGGLLVTQLSWRWVFFVNLPVGVVAVGFGLLFLRRQTVARPGRLDWRGLVLAAGSLATIMYAVSEGPTRGWTSPSVLGCAVAGPVLLATLVFTQLRTPDPLLRLRLYRDGLFASANAAIFVGNAAFFGLLYLIALYLQDELGLSAQSAGLAMLAEAVTVLIGAQLCSRVLFRRFGARRSIVGGLVGVAVAAALMAWQAGGALWGFVVLLALLGTAWSQVFIPATATAFDRISTDDTARASTLFSTMRQFGSAVGIAIVAAVASGGLSDARDYRWPFVSAAALALLGGLLGLGVRTSPRIT